jgi:5-methylcytosine-specific restriction enzyme B
MSFANDVRNHCDRKYVEPARRRGDQFVVIRAGDVHGEMGYRARYPLVCSAIGTKVFEERSRVERVAVEGPLNGANTMFRFKLKP